MSQLEQLRARTDRELVAILDRALDRGLELARSGCDWASAEKVRADAHRLLPKVYNLAERLRLERKLKELRAGMEATFAERMRAAAG